MAQTDKKGRQNSTCLSKKSYFHEKLLSWVHTRRILGPILRLGSIRCRSCYETLPQVGPDIEPAPSPRRLTATVNLTTASEWQASSTDRAKRLRLLRVRDYRGRNATANDDGRWAGKGILILYAPTTDLLVALVLRVPITSSLPTTAELLVLGRSVVRTVRSIVKLLPNAGRGTRLERRIPAAAHDLQPAIGLRWLLRTLRCGRRPCSNAKADEPQLKAFQSLRKKSWVWR